MIKIEVQSKMLIEKFALANAMVDEEIIILNHAFASKARNIARNQIMFHVYALPQAPGTTYSRTMKLFNGVRTAVEGFVGMVYIDDSVRSPKGFYYPVSVEYGLKTNPNYFARHFWVFTKAVIRSEYFRDGILARSIMVKKL